VVLTPFVLPGEEARVAVEPAKGGLYRGRLITLRSASPHRVEPACPYFGRCGGCHYQNADYAFQVSAKAEILREQLRRVGRIDWPGEIPVVTGEPWRYRNRVQVHLGEAGAGYFAAGSHELVPVEACPVACDPIEHAIRVVAGMREYEQFPRFLRSLELFTNGTDVQVNVVESERRLARWFFDWLGEAIAGATAPALDYAACGLSFQVSHESFFQVNRFLIEDLVEAATGGAAGGLALDLYAGVGLFSLALARHFERVVAVEAIGSAVRDLTVNAARAARAVETRQARVEEALGDWNERPDFVIADPPRAGLGKAVVRELIRLGAPELSLVSCDPATLARDLAALSAGGYTIKKVTLIDLFPQTYHIESVVRLRQG
jgi:23S rRNA (uracil1939-C5)-methyltransferase